ncbi:hypothetical protein NtRootA2_41130 (plasmid) [Arthrobacter sp. NtRootA2]|nr:hypothetical protein NtRootA2_41130 [Arthrobacter sp. NtRootA2]
MSTREPIGPPPRRPSAGVQNLVKANRESGPEHAQPAPKPKPARTSAREQVTYYMPADGRKRAKAAFNATRGQEEDASWSEFVTRAVMNEVYRRERLYNEGEPFPGGTRNLTPGRTLAP